MPTYKGKTIVKGRPFTPQAIPRAPIPSPLLQGYGQQPAIMGFTDRKEVQAPTLASQGKVTPQPPPKPGGAAKAAPAYKPQTRPFDARSAIEEGAAQRDVQNQALSLWNEQARAKTSYGLDDASDPFSKAKMLVRNYQQGQAGINTTAGNNFYSGSHQTNLNEGTFQYTKNYAALRREYQDLLANITERGRQATSDYQSRVDEAKLGALERAIERGSTAPTDAPPVAPPGAPAGTPLVKGKVSYGPQKIKRTTSPKALQKKVTASLKKRKVKNISTKKKGKR